MSIYTRYSQYICLYLHVNYHMPLLELGVHNSVRFLDTNLLRTRYTLFITLIIVGIYSIKRNQILGLCG